MKNAYIMAYALALFLTFNQNIQAQTFEKGKTFISVGYGLAHIGTLYKRDIVKDAIAEDMRIDQYHALPLGLQVEYAVTNRWGVGLSAYYEKYDFDYSFIPLFSKARVSLTEKIGLLSVIARANYHFNTQQSRFDPYIGGGLGVTRLFYNIDDWSWDEGYKLTGELRVGCHYFLSKYIATHLEIGLGSIFVQAGLTTKF